MFRGGKPSKGRAFSNLLDGNFYVDDDVFAREKKKIFEKSWIFAASLAQLPRENDYVLLEFFDWSIIVGNFKGAIQAFENRCPHRSSPLFSCAAGNGELKCPFHGWAFDAQGFPRAIPQQREAFGFSDERRKSLRLRTFPTDRIGDLIFVKMPKARTSLSDYLGEMREGLGLFDREWTTRNPQERGQLDCNWKLMAETTLEAYHTSQVHPQTLGVNVSPIDYYNFSFLSNGHQAINIGNHPNRSMMTSAFTILFFFPNLFLVKLDGKHCWLHQILPRSSERTDMRFMTFYPRSSPLSSAEMRMTASAIRLTATEDRQICEGVQKRIRDHRAGQPLANLEEGILRFQEAYLRKMKTFF